MAPNVFHIGVEEKVSISVFDNAQPVTVKLYLQDFPHRRKTFSQVQGVVNQGKFHFLKRQHWRTRSSTNAQLMGCAKNSICRLIHSYALTIASVPKNIAKISQLKLASHQCGPVSNVGRVCYSFSPLLRGFFFTRNSSFPSLQKTNRESDEPSLPWGPADKYF